MPKTVPVDLLTESCLYCRHTATALSIGALFMAMQDHVDWINRHADKANDPHFEEVRLDHLIAH